MQESWILLSLKKKKNPKNFSLYNISSGFLHPKEEKSRTFWFSDHQSTYKLSALFQPGQG